MHFRCIILYPWSMAYGFNWSCRNATMPSRSRWAFRLDNPKVRRCLSKVDKLITTPSILLKDTSVSNKNQNKTGFISCLLLWNQLSGEWQLLYFEVSYFFRKTRAGFIALWKPFSEIWGYKLVVSTFTTLTFHDINHVINSEKEQAFFFLWMPMGPTSE